MQTKTLLFFSIFICSHPVALHLAAQTTAAEDSQFVATNHQSFLKQGSIVTNDLISFAQSSSYLYLSNARKAVNSIEDPRLAMELKLKILQACHNARDASYDLSKPNFTINVVPPLGSAQVTAPSMDPKYIKDPVARKKYEDDIAENDKRRAKWNHERALQRIEDDLINNIKVVIMGQPAESQLSRDFITLIHSNITDKALHEKLTGPLNSTKQ
jgi:hypothetical protein